MTGERQFSYLTTLKCGVFTALVSTEFVAPIMLESPVTESPKVRLSMSSGEMLRSRTIGTTSRLSIAFSMGMWLLLKIGRPLNASMTFRLISVEFQAIH